jgi:hypothetical protein
MRVSAILAGLISFVGFASANDYVINITNDAPNYTRLTMEPKDNLKLTLNENI